MSQNYNKLRRPRARTVIALSACALAAGCSSASSSGSSAHTPAIVHFCETGRVNSPNYQPYPGATDKRRSWGGVLIMFSRLDGSGVFAISTSWRAQSSSWQWVESDALTPENLQSHHDSEIMQVGDGVIQISERFFATDGSLACNGQLPRITFGTPTELYDSMLSDGFAPHWNSDTTVSGPNTDASVRRLSFHVTPEEATRLLAA